MTIALAIGLGRPALDAFAVTPSDSTQLATFARSLYIGVGGDVKLTTPAGSALTFANVQVGSVLPCAASLVWATGTSASNIVALI